MKCVAKVFWQTTVAVIGLVALTFVCQAADGDAPAAPVPPKPGFIIGAWFQPTSNFALWKARGINTLVGYESESNHTSMTQWDLAATDQNLFFIRQPNDNFAADAANPFLLAWLHGDEPDVRKIEPPPLIEAYTKWKRLAPTIPVMMNLSGGNVMFQKTSKATYVDYLKATDWVGNDFYPVTGWNHPDWLAKVGQTVDVLRDWSGGKPQFAFIECSSQKLAWLPQDSRGPTPDEMRAEIWDAVIHGVKGIVYFPQQFNPFSFDATVSKVSLQIARQNRKLNALADILAQPANPPEVMVTVSSPMEVGSRRMPDGKVYLFVLNLSAELQHDQPVKIAGYGGKKAKLFGEATPPLNVFETGFVDNFDPYEVRVYELGAE